MICDNNINLKIINQLFGMSVRVNQLFTLDVRWTYLQHIHHYIKDRNNKVFYGCLASWISLGHFEQPQKMHWVLIIIVIVIKKYRKYFIVGMIAHLNDDGNFYF